MKLSFAFFAMATGAASQNTAEFGELPPGLSDGSEAAWAKFVEGAFPTWCVDENENRLSDLTTCADGSTNGRYDPFYLTKWHGGEDPALGGYPTDVDTRYPFYFASGFFGQACAGGNGHCSFDFDGSKNNCAKCGKIVTDSDDGPNGPGHVPPHIGLAALTRAYYDGDFGDVATWFDYNQNACRVLPSVLLPMIRKYFPRGEDGSVKYPPPFTQDGGPGAENGATYAYPLEYVNLVGDSCTKEQGTFPTADCFESHSNGSATDYPEYLKPGHGSPHYCSVGAMEADVNKDWCPYIFFGPKRGKYRHPHIAYAAVEVWLANKVMPDKCGATWDDNDGKDYPFTPDRSIAFPKMAAVEGHPEDPRQPALKEDGAFIWPGDEGRKRKSVSGAFVIDKFLAPTTIGEPMAFPLLTDGSEPDLEPQLIESSSLKFGSSGYALYFGGFIVAAIGFSP